MNNFRTLETGQKSEPPYEAEMRGRIEQAWRQNLADLTLWRSSTTRALLFRGR